MKRVLKYIMRKFGYEIVASSVFQNLRKPVSVSSNPLTMDQMLARCSLRGLKFNSIVDVGASNGLWAKDCLKYYPEAQYLLVEAQAVHKAGLDQFKSLHPNVDYVLAAAGRTEGVIYFDDSDPFGGIASDTPLAGKCIEVKMTSIDAEVKRRKLKGPFLIKLDTHGYEVPILEGAAHTLMESNGVIIEVYNFNLTGDSLLFYQMCEYMDKLGFRPIDLVDPFLRTHDASFWQMDLLFVRKDREEFKFNKYK